MKVICSMMKHPSYVDNIILFSEAEIRGITKNERIHVLRSNFSQNTNKISEECELVSSNCLLKVGP